MVNYSEPIGAGIPITLEQMIVRHSPSWIEQQVGSRLKLIKKKVGNKLKRFNLNQVYAKVKAHPKPITIQRLLKTRTWNDVKEEWVNANEQMEKLIVGKRGKIVRGIRIDSQGNFRLDNNIKPIDLKIMRVIGE